MDLSSTGTYTWTSYEQAKLEQYKITYDELSAGRSRPSVCYLWVWGLYFMLTMSPFIPHHIPERCRCLVLERVRNLCKALSLTSDSVLGLSVSKVSDNSQPLCSKCKKILSRKGLLETSLEVDKCINSTRV